MSEPSTPRDDETRLFLLVLRCQSGDELAFGRLFEWFSARTLAHLRRLVGDDGEDVQQEVWLTVYRTLRTLHNPRAFRTWLFQTTRRRAIDFLRAKKRDQELREDAMRDMPTSTWPEDRLVALDESSLAAALDALSPIHREVLLLRFQEGMSYGEIAVIAGCSIGTVRSRLHNAKRLLQDAIERPTNTSNRGESV